MLNPRVCITDGSYPHTLEAVRALGRAGSEVYVGERASVRRSACVATWSRYCAAAFHYPDPIAEPRAAVAALAEFCSRHAIDVFLPVSLDMTELAVRHADQLPTPALLPSSESFDIACDKQKTFAFAEPLGIPVPRTVPAAEYRQLDPPCVIKSRRRGAAIAHSREEADRIVAQLGPEIADHLAQEFIPGQNGFGYFGLFDRGVERTFFMHERLMQYPIEGGPSVVCRSFFDKTLREHGRKLLEALRWNGVAMVEFKRSDRDGRFYLMEINPKFWGSLGLAIHAGANFPVWVRDMVLGRKPDIRDYDRSAVYHCIIPNELKCFARYPGYRGRFVRNLLNPRMSSDVSLRDPLPAVMSAASAVLRIFRP